ncbi:MAG: hypothetical protein ACRDQA_13220 [Nocardioidaceae bacterium]
MTARRELPRPAGSDDLATTLRSRYRADSEDSLGVSSETPRTRATSASSETHATGAAESAQTRQRAAVRRSWYMPADAAADLAAAVEEEHFASRRPKAEILAGLIRTALAHPSEWRSNHQEEGS